MNAPDFFPGLLTALGVGLMIGVVRERRHQPDMSKAGTRTHALVAVLGYVSWGFGIWPFVATVLVLGALVIAGYQATARSDPGQTGEVALLVTLMLSALAGQNSAFAAGLGVLVAVLLYAKQASQRISRELITENELQDALMLAAATLVVMPVLPDKPVDPWGVLELTLLWRIVVLVMTVSMFGHVARRTFGGRWGTPLAGFFSGFISSTAVVASMGQRVRAGQSAALAAAAATLLANLASLLLFSGVVGAASPILLSQMLWPLVFAGTGLVPFVLLGLRQDSRCDLEAETGRAFELSQAVVIAVIIALMSFLAAWLQHVFGNIGVLVIALCVAWVEVHAAAASIVQLMQAGGMSPDLAHWGLVAVMASSALAKTILALSSGGIRYGLTVGLGLLTMVTGASAGVAWFI